MQKKKKILDPDLKLYTKINSKWAIDLSARSKTKTLRRNIENLYTFGLGKELLDMTPKAQPRKRKVDKFDLIIIKNLCS